MAEQKLLWWKPNANASWYQNQVQLSPLLSAPCVVVTLRVALLGFQTQKWIAA
jgi:hypothetical protein